MQPVEKVRTKPFMATRRKFEPIDTIGETNHHFYDYERVLMSECRRIIFDLTLSARWPGPPLGIVRTERQLALLAAETASLPVEYSIYDQLTKSYFLLKPEVARRIIAGSLVVMPPAEPVETPLRAVKPHQPIRFRCQPRKYLMSLLGFDVTDRPPPKPEPSQALPTKKIALEDAVLARLKPTSGDILVSCGADWHGKDLPKIRAEKMSASFRYVAVCYDVIPWRWPHYWPSGVAESVVAYYGELAWLADTVVCISQATAREYTEFCGEMDIPCPKLAVFRLGEADLSASMSRKGSQVQLPSQIGDSRFVLMVSALEPRKNHWLLYHAWEDLVLKKSIDPDIKLVFVGAGYWMTEDLLQQIKAHPLLHERIVVLRGVSDEQLHLLYEKCLFTVYPSFHEGWGLPVAESLKYGKVCISSNRGSLPEISPLAILLDPLDVYAWRDAIRDHIVDASLRKEAENLIRKEFAPTSWEQSAREFFSAVITQ